MCGEWDTNWNIRLNLVGGTREENHQFGQPCQSRWYYINKDVYEPRRDQGAHGLHKTWKRVLNIGNMYETRNEIKIDLRPNTSNNCMEHVLPCDMMKIRKRLTDKDRCKLYELFSKAFPPSRLKFWAHKYWIGQGGHTWCAFVYDDVTHEMHWRHWLFKSILVKVRRGCTSLRSFRGHDP